LLYTAAILLDPEGIEHSRIKYDLLMCFGDVGGIYAFILPLLGFFICPISEHSFTLTAANELFFAKHQEGKCRNK